MCHTSTTKRNNKGMGAEKAPAAKSPLPQPKFTVADLKAAIPAHCFVRSTAKSLGYLAMDLAMIAGLFMTARYLCSVLPTFAQFAIWPLYWYAQGAVMTGVWVLAHECGHGAFSDSKTVNDIVGTVCHSLLLVPYHAWRISHGKHHRSTGDMDNDEVFLPATKDEVDPVNKPSKPTTMLQIALMEVFGWPLYLASNVTGPRKYRGKTNSHFNSNSVLFNDRERSDVAQSLVAFGVAVAVLAGWVATQGLWHFVSYYFVPLLVVNFWLVTITYLQHTDTDIPHYRGKEWTWLRGALATVDRDYGLLNTVFHGITDTHVAHHLFSYMPFYHAREATEAIKPILGEYYNQRDTPVFKALWTSFRECRYVDLDEGDVLYYHN